MVSLTRFLVLLISLGYGSYSWATTINVDSDRNPVGLDESFTLSYSADGGVDDDPDFSPLKPYVDILGQSESSNISFINGHMSRKKVWNLSVIARKVGELELPPIHFGSDTSSPYRLKVTKSSTPDSASSALFSKVTVEQTPLYPQQQLIVTQQLFTSQNLSGYALGELRFSGVNVESKTLGEEKKYQTRIDGKAYLVIEKKIAVFPQQAGTLTIEPTLSDARLASSNSSRFDPFGGMPGFSNGKLVRTQSDAVSIAVKPLPANATAPWLPAHDLVIDQQWSGEIGKVIQGEPITRTLSIAANGLTSAQLPELPTLEFVGVKQYPDKALLRDQLSDLGVTGNRVEKTALIATRPGSLTLPEIRIPWWDSDEQTFKTAIVPAVTLTVLPAPNKSMVTPAPIAAPQVQDSAPAQRQTSSSPGATQSRPDSTTALAESAPEEAVWKYAAIGMGTGWILTLLAWWLLRNQPAKSNSPKPPGSDRKPGHTVQAAYSELKQACNHNDAKSIRQATINWLKARSGQTNISDVDIKSVSETLAKQLRQLDVYLYAANDHETKFECKSLLKQVEALMKSNIKAKQKPSRLEEFSP